MHWMLGREKCGRHLEVGNLEQVHGSHSVYSRNRMPGWCSAYSCSNERTVNNRNRGITFHKFPKDKDVRKKWEVALRREGFTASDYSVVCSQHFKQADFDRTGQIVRLRDGVIPSLFRFPVHLQKGRAASTSRRADESLSVASNDSPEMTTSHPQPQPYDDHGYALPASPTAVKAKVNEHLARVESLAREKKNAMSREKRAKTTVKGLLGDLRENNLINEELREKLAFYSDLKTDFVAKQGHEYSQDCSCVPLEPWSERPCHLHLTRTSTF
ncbi:THAP domain-containing protein 6-like isoform X2 [Gadus chalcogrammus]|uniref:THAP domain-containing protein 6-like isoform X2 n=1 Tax=Gadus chalcogrammus TaxID=1042646 RepID=UPI0024C2CAF3|nr:THAP domain-containing protein 6-like isoform X2 [Gadus chalcogrammus]